MSVQSLVRKTPGVGNGNPLQNSCPGHPTDREAWQATGYGVTESEAQLGTAQPRVSACTAVGVRKRLCLGGFSPAVVHHAVAQAAFQLSWHSWAVILGGGPGASARTQG